MAFNFDLKGILTGMLLPILLGQGAEALKGWLDDFQTKEPSWHKTIIIISHRLLSVHGSELAASTANPYDDKAIETAVKAIEENAAKHGIVLSS